MSEIKIWSQTIYFSNLNRPHDNRNNRIILLLSVASEGIFIFKREVGKKKKKDHLTRLRASGYGCNLQNNVQKKK